ncbi:hypothetical protein [Burkholderia vietnamiensis]|uniref:hypothetical protein n=1 Tax=Burkholderia vietnamiensis TaxID=60552 RepID=UPI001E55EB53|nr:hypothetical protein [Burkholderia vietnamiensis]
MNNHIGIKYSNMVEFVRALPYRAGDARAVGDVHEHRQAGGRKWGAALSVPEKSTNYDHKRFAVPVSRLHGSL